MAVTINYRQLDPRSRLSRTGAVSFSSGILAFPCFLYAFLYGPPPGATVAMRWIALVAIVVVPLVGFVCGIVALASRKRLWWLALFGTALSGIPLAVDGLVIILRLLRIHL